MQPTIIYEDNHLLVVNKPIGLLVQGDRTGDTPLLDLCKDYIKEKYDKPGAVYLGLTHRLDRPVSGVVVFARTSKALTRINEQFRSHSVKKHYLALTEQRPDADEQELLDYMIKDEKRNISKVVQNSKKAKKAHLKFRLIGQYRPHYLLHIQPTTGRSHQIRVQLSHHGCPLAGDLKYGASKPLAKQSIGLHCYQMEIIHPTLRTSLSFKAPVPDHPAWRPFHGLISSAFDSFE